MEHFQLDKLAQEYFISINNHFSLFGKKIQLYIYLFSFIKKKKKNFSHLSEKSSDGFMILFNFMFW